MSTIATGIIVYPSVDGSVPGDATITGSLIVNGDNVGPLYAGTPGRFEVHGRLPSSITVHGDNNMTISCIDNAANSNQLIIQNNAAAGGIANPAILLQSADVAQVTATNRIHLSAPVVTVSNAPTIDLAVATKKYVDDLFAGSTSIYAADGTIGPGTTRTVTLDTSTLDFVYNPGSPITLLQLNGTTGAITLSSTGLLSLASTGGLIEADANAGVTTPKSVATKEYVDNTIATNSVRETVALPANASTAVPLTSFTDHTGSVQIYIKYSSTTVAAPTSTNGAHTVATLTKSVAANTWWAAQVVATNGSITAANVERVMVRWDANSGPALYHESVPSGGAGETITYSVQIVYA